MDDIMYWTLTEGMDQEFELDKREEGLRLINSSGQEPDCAGTLRMLLDRPHSIEPI
jgi:hypothetical protein